MVGYMPKVAGSWLAGTHDADRAVATAAQNALRGTFTTEEKIHNVSKVFQGSILEYCRDAVLEETVQTLSDERTVSADDAEATYARVLSTSLNVVASLISSLSREDLNKHLHIYETLLGEPKVWALAAYKDVTVRRSLLNLLKTSESKLEGRSISFASYRKILTVRRYTGSPSATTELRNHRQGLAQRSDWLCNRLVY